jgi:hypothetical protein
MSRDIAGHGRPARAPTPLRSVLRFQLVRLMVGQNPAIGQPAQTPLPVRDIVSPRRALLVRVLLLPLPRVRSQMGARTGFLRYPRNTKAVGLHGSRSGAHTAVTSSQISTCCGIPNKARLPQT